MAMEVYHGSNMVIEYPKVQLPVSLKISVSDFTVRCWKSKPNGGQLIKLRLILLMYTNIRKLPGYKFSVLKS